MTQSDPNKFSQGEKVVSSIVKTLPNKPGVYRMLDETGSVLYVGKAKNLKNRVSSYSRVTGHSLRIGRMISATRDMNFFITETELEALLLEQNLIKKYSPRYNVLLKDDKSFPQIAITKNKQFPQVTKYRGKKVDGVKYFGPYASATAVNNAINYIQKIFQLRNCGDSNFYGRSRACLLHYINKCSAPCVGKISEEEYSKTVDTSSVWGMAINDFDSDGFTELIYGTSGGEIFLYDGETEDYESKTSALSSKAGHYGGIAVGNVDGEGPKEMLIGSNAYLWLLTTEGQTDKPDLAIEGISVFGFSPGDIETSMVSPNSKLLLTEIGIGPFSGLVSIHSPCSRSSEEIKESL